MSSSGLRGLQVFDVCCTCGKQMPTDMLRKKHKLWCDTCYAVENAFEIRRIYKPPIWFVLQHPEKGDWRTEGF